MSHYMKYVNLLAVIVLLISIAYVVAQFTSGQGLFFRTDQAAVVQEMRSLNRLETSVFTIEKIIEAGTQSNVFQEFLFGDRLLLIAHGQVIAGVDLSKLETDDVTLRGETVTIQLPPTEIFMTDLDESKTRVYDRRQGLLTRGQTNLEGEARKVAEEQIRQAACEAGILTKAAENASRQLTQFLEALDFAQVTVKVEAGQC